MNAALTPLRSLRVLRGLRLRDISMGTSIYSSRLSRLERGLARPFKREARALSIYFRVPVEEIFPAGAGHHQEDNYDGLAKSRKRLRTLLTTTTKHS